MTTTRSPRQRRLTLSEAYHNKEVRIARLERVNAALLAAAKALRGVAEDKETYRAWKREFDALDAAVDAAEREA